MILRIQALQLNWFYSYLNQAFINKTYDLSFLSSIFDFSLGLILQVINIIQALLF